MISSAVKMSLWNLFSSELALLVLALIGAYVLLIYLIDNLKSVVGIVKSLLMPFFQPQAHQTLSEKFGTWAVVTGSTDGIGKEYCHELARKGINIVLIARNKEKLVNVANELESQHKVKTKWIVADFSKDKSIYDHIARELEGIPVGILVNNVGLMYDYPEELSKVPEQRLWDLINVNMAACTMMSHMIIPQMKKAGKGAIVNISSGSELQPLPLMAVYAASKLYVKSFTLALQHELAPYGLTIQLVTPMYVVTKMNQYSSEVMKGGFLIPDVKSFTKSAVFTLGKSNETTGYWSHGLQYAVFKLVPSSLRASVGHKMNAHFRKMYFLEQEQIETIS